MQLTRRHRITVLALAGIAGGVFTVFLTRVFLQPAPPADLRVCDRSPLYEDLPFEEMKRRYHYVMEKLTEERMDLYEGREPLHCRESEMKYVIPKGEFASRVHFLATNEQELRHVPWPQLGGYQIPGYILYQDFEHLLTEFWRTYDCHLFALQADAPALAKTSGYPVEDQTSDTSVLPGNIDYVSVQEVGRERERAERTLSSLLWVLRSSEQYLPLHAALRCLQRGAIDVRNAMALLTDASQCAAKALAEPVTSILQ